MKPAAFTSHGSLIRRVKSDSSSSDTSHPIFIADPRILIIPIHENHEPLIDLRTQSSIALGPSPEIPNNTDYTWVRQSVYDRLLAAQKLLPAHLQICLYEGYRSLSLQERIFQERRENLKKLNPEWEDKFLFKETTRLVSPVNNLDGSRNTPPHSTGAAVDVYLIERSTGQAIEMGIHPKDWMQDDAEGSVSQTESVKISPCAQENRLLLSKVLKERGFVNYPCEYWHWSYGDRYWAYQEGKPYALYDTLQLPNFESAQK